MQNVGKAVVVVAHPDDCIIFALPFIKNHPHFKWHIIYLTYNERDPRAQEVTKFWNKQNVSTEFLGFVDNYQDQETQTLNFWTQNDAEIAITNSISQHGPDVVVTHNHDGDYGHIHHKIVHYAVDTLDIPQVYFASTFNLTDTFKADDYDLKQLPLHQEVIQGFQDRLIGRYIITDQARQLI